MSNNNDEELNTINIHFLLEMKNSIQQQNEYIECLIEETKRYNYNHTQWVSINNIINCRDKMNFDELNERNKNNDKLIAEINTELNNICKHDIMHDYIETGVESDMREIIFCRKCNLNM